MLIITYGGYKIFFLKGEQNRSQFYSIPRYKLYKKGLQMTRLLRNIKSIAGTVVTVATALLTAVTLIKSFKKK
jgi:hypothetical protein